MRFKLRDLFWLLLVVACLTVWGVDHRNGSRRINALEGKTLFRIASRSPASSEAEIRRKEELNAISKISDEELDQRFRSLASDKHSHQYEPCLVEMARRRMASQLQKHYDEHFAGKRAARGWPENDLVLLTALRRSQGAPDPLTIHMSENQGDYPKRDAWTPCLRATIENVDVEGKEVTFTHGCDDRGGRHEKWRFVLLDERGRSVADSNHYSWSGGGIGHSCTLKLGESDTGYWFDLRTYLAPPPSGTYQLQALYNDEGIAGEPDVSGLIVTKSDPIWVVVENPDGPVAVPLLADVRPFLAALAACGTFAVALITRKALRRAPAGDCSAKANARLRLDIARDLSWCILILLLAVGWGFDLDWQAARIRELQPDDDARWSISITP
jgi:hypothetical protein